MINLMCSNQKDVHGVSGTCNSWDPFYQKGMYSARTQHESQWGFTVSPLYTWWLDAIGLNTFY